MDSEQPPSAGQLYSEDEVANSGYPGALMVLGAPLALMGLVIGVGAVFHGDLLSAGFVTVLVTAPGAGLVIKALRARRAQVRPWWICWMCGYDRRGLGEDAPCPECGKQQREPIQQ